MTPNAYDRDLLRTQIDILRRAAALRSRLENEISIEHEAATSHASTHAEQLLAAIKKKYKSDTSVTQKEYEAVVQQLNAAATADQQKLELQRTIRLAEIVRQHESKHKKLEEDYQFEEGSYKEVYKDKRKQPVKQFLAAEKELAKTTSQIDECQTKCRQYLVERRVPVQHAADQESTGTDADDNEPLSPLPIEQDLLKLGETLRLKILEQTMALSTLKSARTAFAGGTQAAVIILPLLIAVLGAIAAFVLMPGTLPDAIVLKSIASLVVGLSVFGLALGIAIWLLWRLRRKARQESQQKQTAIDSDIDHARRCLAATADFLKARRDSQLAQLDDRFTSDTQSRKAALETTKGAILEESQAANAALEKKVQAYRESILAKQVAGREAADKKYPARLAALTSTAHQDVTTTERTRDEQLAAAAKIREQRYLEMTHAWQTQRTETAEIYAAANSIDARAFRPWTELASEDVPLPTEAPIGLRFGTLVLSLEKLPGGVSADPHLNSFGPRSWHQPAIMPFPSAVSLLIKTTGDQKDIASEMLQALTLRIASGIPAGQSRFTIIDPLGLGKHFAGFMHLADYDELLVTSRIWTEPPQIEQRLADITEQMELVIQKYLRNEYESIGAYNADAEVLEPYRFVVVANFPANFTETSARRLASIAASGARCGVYTIISVDTKQTMPANFSLADIEKYATTLVLKDGVFTWTDPEYSRWPLVVEQIPSDEVFTQVIQRVGKAAKAAKRVEVPFDRVAPKEENWWKGSTASEIDVALGPAGAKKMQHMKLGKGTSQHVLIAGKTGSGKSTMMHALITNLALTYSPSEVQFYLIDFKKGVEFKIYDHYRLPHARVIAIESEREFGLSVLEQLDRELKHRGDLFRDLAVQDLAGYRKTGHPEPMPRVLLIIDEFQEIFIEDDKLAQDASLVLDRLVRQGRAFGMHVLLGSQTLGGSYSLPRSTMGQMAVRIALQCNEADSSLILSEENSAARLLTRPGEAIYNDANGMVTGNNPFQVVWLNDESRESYLSRLRALADSRTDIPVLPRLVFDGNQAADPAGNPMLLELLNSDTVGGKPLLTPLAWLGDAIAIKDPTAAIFRRQGGANLLVVGQREDLAVSLLAMSILSLAAAHDPFPGGQLARPARFVIFEPSVADEHPDLLLNQLPPYLPHEVEMIGRLAVAHAFEELATEVKRRIDEQVLDGEAVFVVVRDLARFRELRRSEGDMGFSFGGEQKTGPAQNFVTLLKDGPTVGIHMLIWCDSLTNLMRTFERSTLKEFELRVLFQMSASDSSVLVDSPFASKLGPQRALFIHEETGTLEKFRPYSFPSHEWLAGISTQMKARTQGTPGVRPTAKPSSTSSDAAHSGSGLKTDFGADEFNFTKFLDDPPTS